MARTLKTNENNDIHAINGRLQISTGLNAVLQTCERVVKTLIGELQFNKRKGIDYFGNIFSGSPNVLSFEASARRQIVSVSNVISVVSFESSITDNKLSYTAVIKTTFGEGRING